MKKLIAMTALILGVGIVSAQPAYAERYWDGHGWHERTHRLVARDRYHGGYAYPGYGPAVYGGYVEPVEPVYAAPVYAAPAPVVYAPQPALGINVRL